MAKATHQGECQLCGSMQKLPSGSLSIHGYTTQWGFFSGTCGGSHHLPFEQSTDVIEAAITRTIAGAAQEENKAADLEKPATNPVATCRIFRTWRDAKNDGKEGYAWVSGTIEPRPPKHGLRFVVIEEDGEESYIHADNYSDDVLAVATQHNRGFAKTLRNKAARMRAYVEWQKDRVAKWKPRDLTPVPGVVEIVHLEAKFGKFTTTFCVGSMGRARDSIHKPRTQDAQKVTCQACIKKMASREKAEREQSEKQEKAAAKVAARAAQ